MKNKIKYIFLSLALLLILLVGCAEAGNEAYDEALNNGLEEIRIENYEKAEEYFEMALEEEADDVRAETLLNQTQSYVAAVSFFDQEQYDEAIEKAEFIQSLEDGSSILEFKASELMKEIQAIQDEPAVVEEKETTEKETSEEVSPQELFEEYKGAYAVFAREKYEWPVDFLFIIGDDFIVSGYQQTGVYRSDIVNKMIDGDTLYLHTFAEEKFSNKEKQHKIKISYNDQNGKNLHLDSGEILYPITVDDVIETGFGLMNDSFSILEDLRVYDEEVTQMVSYSNTSLLNDYSTQEIEYARVWLNVVGNEGITELNITQEKAGEIINYSDDNSPVWPEDVTVLTGWATADGMVTYSGNGDGTINIYPVPGHWHTPDEDLPELYEEILNPTTIYLEPMKDEQVIDIIYRINQQ